MDWQLVSFIFEYYSTLDSHYIKGALSEALLSRGLQVVTRVKKKMKKGLISLLDKALLRKRAIIDSVNDQLKNIRFCEPKKLQDMKLS